MAENTSLTTFDLTVNSCFVDADLGEDLGESLLRSTSLTSLSLTFNYSNIKEGWECKLVERLIKMASLTTFSLNLNGDGEWNQEDCLSPTKLCNVLAAIKSLSSLSVAIHSDSMHSFWNKVVGDCLRECTSLKKLSLTFSLDDYSESYFCGFTEGLTITTSLNTLSVAVLAPNHKADLSRILDDLTNVLSSNLSVNTLTVTMTVIEPDYLYADRWYSFTGLSVNMSITTLNLKLNEHGEGISDIPEVLRKYRVFQLLAQSTSVTTFNLTLNSSKEVSDDWLPGLCDALKKNTSLTTLRLKLNNHCATGESRLYDFRKLVIESQTLTLLELEVSFYGKDSGWQMLSIQ